MATEKPLVVIIGPTASGKSAAAIKLAQKLGGELICADSRTIYKCMDIGTAKPSAEDRALVPHWGLDLVEPGTRFTAADFKDYATAKIAEVRSRGNVPIIVGGTGLYVDAVIFDYQFGYEPKDSNSPQRSELELMTTEDLKRYCIDNNIPLPENANNKRHLVRQIERGGVNSNRKTSPISNTIIVGITTENDVLKQRIYKRAEQFVEDGIVEEAQKLAQKYGWESEAMTGNAYPIVKQYLDGSVTKDEMSVKFAAADWKLVKRQRTWFKRNPYIKWVNLEDVLDAVVESIKTI